MCGDSLGRLLQATGLDIALNNSTAMMTVFVPINAAFDALAMQMNQTLGVIMAQKGVLQQVLSLDSPTRMLLWCLPV